ncbi:hypothetical protein GCM10009733_056470 [Nonomuraea maheshkhaliensis]|uniref:Cytosine permease n=1 Tax=Nonomuraea maheshkhaliensis TaxID=419590 RepID=A0ABP4RNI2_9ACTN
MPFDDHGIEPIPAAARDSTPWQQFWIWTGANIAPINWVLGALGITLGLSLVETIVVVAAGNLVGCAVFGLFNLMGHRTGANQMVLMAVMTVLAVAQTDPDWTAATAVTPADKVTAVTQLLTAIGIGWGISWLPYSAGHSRFVRPGTPGRRVFWAAALGMYVPTVWLAALGACLAGGGGTADPSSLVTGLFGVMAVPVLPLITHGPVATNILNLYSCSLAALSVGIKVARWKLTLGAGLVAPGVLAVFLRADDFAQAFDHWMVSILVWIAPWASIVLVDFLVLRKGRIDLPSLYRDDASPYGPVNRSAMISLGAGLVAAWGWQLGIVPATRGPIARLLNDTDFSWLSGGLVAGGLYHLLVRRAARRLAARAPEEVPAI